MSMINDALRRASSMPNPAGEPSAVQPPPLPWTSAFPENGVLPAEQPVEESKSNSLPILLLAIFLFCLAGAAGLYLWERTHRSTSVQAPASGAHAAAAQPPITAMNAVSNFVPATARTLSRVTANAAVAATNIDVVSAARGIVNPATAPPAPAAASGAPAQFPTLRLQGIYYRPENPSVMINGHTLYLNDTVQGVTVASIDTSSVTLVLSGRTNILTLR